MRTPVAVSLLSLGALFGAHVLLFGVRPPGSQSEASAPLSRPFQAEIGLAWQARVPVSVPSDLDGRGSSRLQLLDAGTMLGPAHAQHATIRDKGRGAFSHWGETLYFSTPDGSDPNTNGRNYVVVVTEQVAVWPHLVLVMVDLTLVLGIGLWLLTRPGRWRGIRRMLRPWFAVAVTAIAIEVPCGILCRNRLAVAGEPMQALVAATLDGGTEHSFHGESVQYCEHHYLNYVLNPDFRGGVARQFERAHRIRRTEPLRSRDRVRWRILVLGGSTTYGEQLDDEADTWVYRLERRLRGEIGPDVEVINGGVGGYNVLENAIHYWTLLSSLEPDLVLLYVGINDVHPRLFGTLATDYSNYRIPWRSEGNVLPVPLGNMLWSNTYRFYYLQRYVEPLRRNGIGAVAAREYPDVATWAESLARNGPQVYRDHLQNLIRLLLEQGHGVGVLPQYFVAITPADAVFLEGVTQHNVVNREVAARLGVPFAERVVAEGAFARGDTFDRCHFTPSGSERMATIVAEFLRDQHLLPR